MSHFWKSAAITAAIAFAVVVAVNYASAKFPALAKATGT